MRSFHRALSALAASLSVLSCVPAATGVYASSEKMFSELEILKADNTDVIGLPDKVSFYRNGQVYTSTIQVEWDVDISVLVPRFIASEGASVVVNDAPVIPGETAVDFRGGAHFSVTAEDGSSVEYNVFVKRKLKPPASGLIGVNVTVASYNAEDFFAGNTNRHAQIAQVMKNNSVEVLVLTETKADTPGNDVAALQTKLAEIGCPLPYSYAAMDPYNEDDIVVLSKYEIAEAGIVTPPGTWPRPGASATLMVREPADSLDADYALLTVFGFHLKASTTNDPAEDAPTNLAKRIAQASSLSTLLKARPVDDYNKYFVVAGDMNTLLPGDRTAATSTLGYLCVRDDAVSTNDLWPANETELPTTSTHQLGSVLDHIILSPSLKARYQAASVQVLKSDPDVDLSLISDHFPVLLELAL